MYFNLLFLMVIIVPMIVLSRQMQRAVPPYRAVFEAVVGVAIACVLIFILSALSGQPLGVQLASNVDTMAGFMVQNEGVMQALGMGKLSGADRIMFLREIYAVAINVIPGTLMEWSCIAAYFEYILLAKRFNKKEEKVIPMPRLKYFSLPRNALMGFVVIFLLSWITGAVGIVPNGLLTSNVRIIFEFVFSVQGLAVLFLLLDSKKIPRAVQIILAIFLFLTGLGRTMLFLAGLTDFVFDLRGKISQNLHLK